MLEQEVIQTTGFRNVKKEGKITGFNVPIRLTWYRGAWLSLLRPATVIVDGEKFEGDQITWIISGNTYAQTDLEKYPDIQWPRTEAAILTVNKPGGLALGIHEVQVAYSYIGSYYGAPRPDEDLPSTHFNKRTLVLAG